MSVADNIRFYREQAGLSQEELAAKMPVDVSWITYWEDGAGEPRLVDIARLSQVLGVTADDLIKEREIVPLVKEEYTMQYTWKDMKKYLRQYTWLGARGAIVAVVILLILSIGDWMYSGFNNWFVITAVVAVILAAVHLIIALVSRVRFRKVKKTIADRIYTYRIYDGSVEALCQNSAGELVESAHAAFNKIEKIVVTRQYLTLVVEKKAWVLRKDCLPPDSEFLRLPILYPRKTKGQSKKIEFNTMEIVGLLLFAGSILAFPLGIGLFAWLSETNHMDVGNMWVFWTLAPIPIASIILGFALKKKKYRYRRNLIAGFIVLPLLLIYGCFSLFFAQDYSEAPLLELEQILEMDLPESEIVKTMEYSDGTVRTEILFSEENAQQLLALLEDDPRWLDNVPDELEGIVSDYTLMLGGKYIIIYNVDTQQMNELPEQSGTYRMYDISVNPTADRIMIENYILVYEE